jgi:Acetyltransferase (isoleucine patch superfamily)
MSRKLLPILNGEIKDWVEVLLIRNMPGRIGFGLRRLYWNALLKKSGRLSLSLGCVITSAKNIVFGDNVNVMHNCSFYAHNNGSISIGDRVSMNSNVQVNAADSGSIIVGNDVAIGPNVVIRASNHNYRKKDVRINEQGHAGGTVIIEDDVWIGANCVILAGVVIRRGAIIGAGALVNRDIPPYALAGGVPAAVIRVDARE